MIVIVNPNFVPQSCSVNGSTETKPTWVVGLGGLLEPRGFLLWRKLRKSVRILEITVVESLSGVEGKVFLFFSVYFLKCDINPLCVWKQTSFN